MVPFQCAIKIEPFALLVCGTSFCNDLKNNHQISAAIGVDLISTKEIAFGPQMFNITLQHAENINGKRAKDMLIDWLA